MRVAICCYIHTAIKVSIQIAIEVSFSALYVCDQRTICVWSVHYMCAISVTICVWWVHYMCAISVTISVRSVHYMCAISALYVCDQCTICVRSVHYMCVISALYVCDQCTICVWSVHYTCVISALYVCDQCTICVISALYVWSVHYMCVSGHGGVVTMHACKWFVKARCCCTEYWSHTHSALMQIIYEDKLLLRRVCNYYRPVCNPCMHVYVFTTDSYVINECTCKYITHMQTYI
jgi:hypothetical protein